MNIELLEKINEIKDEDDKKEISEEVIRLNYYKQLVLDNQYGVIEVQNYIIKIINKYRLKPEDCNYYNNKNGKDDISDFYTTLCLLENMIFQYVCLKVLEKEEK